MARRTLLIGVRVTEKEKAMIEALSTSYGDERAADVLRRCMQERFIKAFPLYARKGDNSAVGVPSEQLTPEQICEKLGGRVGKNESGAVCLLPWGVSGTRSVPMSLMGQGDYKA